MRCGFVISFDFELQICYATRKSIIPLIQPLKRQRKRKEIAYFAFKQFGFSNST